MTTYERFCISYDFMAVVEPFFFFFFFFLFFFFFVFLFFVVFFFTENIILSRTAWWRQLPVTKCYIMCSIFYDTMLSIEWYRRHLINLLLALLFYPRFRFIPKENGVHFVDVKLNDHHVPDSPFAVMVGSTAADPAMVHAHGAGLEVGTCSTYFL